MKFILDIYHPAQVHQFKYVVKRLQGQGHEIKILVINKDVTLNLLNAYGLSYEIVLKKSGSGVVEKVALLLQLTMRMIHISYAFKPDIYIGRPSLPSSICAFLFRKPHITYDDDDVKQTKYLHLLCAHLLDTRIITPKSFKHEYGKHHIKVDSFKELFYLHPQVYLPDITILSKYGLQKGQYIIVRLVSWNAYHDVNQHGIIDKIGLLHELSLKMKVIVFSENPDDVDLQEYTLPASPDIFHDILANAALLVSDSQTVTTEAAMLGVPAIRCNTWVGDDDAGNFKILEDNYHLIYNIRDEHDILPLVDKILQITNYKDLWLKKRDQMLEGKVNMTQYFVDYVMQFREK